jgi:hypothetical protein
MAKYVTVDTAMTIYKIERDKLQMLIDKKLVTTALLCSPPRECITIIERDSLAAFAANWLVNRADFAHLEQPITMSQAARKYSFRLGTVARWAETGMIHTMGMRGTRRLVNEADVAYLRQIVDTCYSGDVPHGRKLIIKENPF